MPDRSEPLPRRQDAWWDRTARLRPSSLTFAACHIVVSPPDRHTSCAAGGGDARLVLTSVAADARRQRGLEPGLQVWVGTHEPLTPLEALTKEAVGNLTGSDALLHERVVLLGACMVARAWKPEVNQSRPAARPVRGLRNIGTEVPIDCRTAPQPQFRH